MSNVRTPRLARWLVGVAVVLAVASAGAGALLALRVDRYGRLNYLFLVWNLGLAWVPFVLALVMAALHRRGGPRPLLVVLGVAWLAFLPNAPYILTDFIHLGKARGAPLWFDATLIGTFAAVGLGLGLVSLLIVHHIVEAYAGRLVGWLVATGSLVLSAVGMYLGRFPRFNSWDVLTNPGVLADTVVSRLVDPLGNPFLVRFVAVSSVLLVTAYVVGWWLRRRLVGPPAPRERLG